MGSVRRVTLEILAFGLLGSGLLVSLGFASVEVAAGDYTAVVAPWGGAPHAIYLPILMRSSGLPVPLPTPTATQTQAATPTVTPSPTLPPLTIVDYSPNQDSPLDELVILRGPEHLFDPYCEVSGGVGVITATWYDNGAEIPGLTQIDPEPMSLEPGEHKFSGVFEDAAGKTLELVFPTVVKAYLPPIGGGVAGVMAHMSWSIPEEDWQRALDLMEDAHAAIIRTHLNWGWIELSKGVWWFDLFDSLVLMLDSRGMGILASPWGTPQWANPDATEPRWRWPPTDMDGYAEFVGKAVERYDGDGYLDAPVSPRIDCRRRIWPLNMLTKRRLWCLVACLKTGCWGSMRPTNRTSFNMCMITVAEPILT